MPFKSFTKAQNPLLVLARLLMRAGVWLCVWLYRMGIVLAIVLPPSHEETAITNLRVHVVPSDAGYVVVLFLWLQVRF
jgi:hypothetical protein